MCRPNISKHQKFDQLHLNALGGGGRSQKFRCYKSPTGRDFLEVRVGPLHSLSLYDTGSDVTLMHTKVFEQIRECVLGTIDPAPPGLSQACGAPVKDVFSCQMNLHIGDRTKRCHVFVCPSVGHDMILGKPDIDKYEISYDATEGERRLLFPGESLVKPAKSRIIKAGETAMVTCTIDPMGRAFRGGTQFTIDSELTEDDTDLYIPPVMVRGYQSGDTIDIPVHNLSVNDINLKEIDIMKGIGTAARAKEAIPLEAFKIGDLPMPELTECPKEKRDYLLKNIQIGPELPLERHAEFKELVLKYHQAFGADEYNLGKTDSYVHKIRLTDPKPVFNKQFPLSEHATRFLREHIKELVRIGVLENSQSQWNSCCFVVPKASGAYRMVIDLRSVNAKTVPAIHNGATVEDIMKCLGSIGANMFSSCDVLKGFWQIPLDPDSREFTSFNIPTIGSYRYTVAPMGASGSCYAFWTLMSAVTHGLTNTLAYLDDLLTASRTVEDHMEHLRLLFRRMIMHKLTMGLPKCSFFQQQVDFLGFEVAKEGMRPAKPKTEVVKLIEPPSTHKEIRGFVGLAGYFGHHFPFQREAKHLTSLTRKESGWTRGELPDRAKEAFERIKAMLVTRPLLHYPNYNKEFLLFTDAATGAVDEDDKRQIGGLGAFLAQENEAGKLVPIGYAGRGLRSHENNYSAYALELAAALFGLDEFNHIIERFPTRLFTDHQPLQAFMNPLSKTHRKTLNRLQESLMERDLKIQYHPGLLNGMADTLSRIKYRKSLGYEAEEHPIIAALEKERGFKARMNKATEMFVPVWNHTAEEIGKMQDEDPLLGKVKKHLRKEERSQDPAVLQAAKMSVVTAQNILFQRRQGTAKKARYLIHAPEQMKEEIMAHGHDGRMAGAHCGKDRTVGRIRTLFTWDEMVQEVYDYVLSCDLCQSKDKAPDNKTGKLREMPVERKFNDRVHMDTFGDIPVDQEGNKYILVFVDAFTRYAKFVAVPNKEAKTVAKAFFKEWACMYGPPLVAVSDNGTEFVNSVMEGVMKMLGTEHRKTSPYHPQSNGKCERVNPTVKEYIRSFVDWRKDIWSECLAELNFSYNTAIHQGIRMSPFEVVYNYQPRYPGFENLDGLKETFYSELEEDELARGAALVREFAANQSEKFQAQWNQRMNKFRTDPNYKVGDQVMFYAPERDSRRRAVKGRKYINPWIGPCKIVKHAPNSVTVRLWVPPGPDHVNGAHADAHVQRIKPYIDRTNGRWVRSEDLAESELPEEVKKQKHDQLMKELEAHQESLKELDYDGETTTKEAMDFLDVPLNGSPGDMVEWPGAGGSPIPQVEVEDPNMDPRDHARLGVQGHLGNPKGTRAQKYLEKTAMLTPDRVVIRVPPKEEHPYQPKASPEKEEGPARNTRRATKRREAARETFEGRVESLGALPRVGMVQLHELPSLLFLGNINLVKKIYQEKMSRRGVEAVHWTENMKGPMCACH